MHTYDVGMFQIAMLALRSLWLELKCPSAVAPPQPPQWQMKQPTGLQFNTSGGDSSHIPSFSAFLPIFPTRTFAVHIAYRVALTLSSMLLRDGQDSEGVSSGGKYGKCQNLQFHDRLNGLSQSFIRKMFCRCDPCVRIVENGDGVRG
jgi:hypothetical protein